ncbi:large conductance mechanosensitive channel protein MscL [Peptoniphilus sp. MSJ-1]|uniref:Large-conductance mechanosensitive channel n=1 Tax=Peptoniphilus ovalis TaxID=2841503 RepID=A0ABS6FFF4_9FIRM|nr:large conductance mechanosensitive channel protein MscL [Peptoniphilus ovalis]MBU5668681.1 large conductance mechanosensitive channel protein MscL [Peptoniphilus ovalis]
MKGFIKDFKDFIARGNVLDMAVGVIIGAAFGKIVSSLVDNILTPLLGILIGGVNFEDLSIVVGTAEVKYGAFIQSVFDFLIIAFVIFTIIRQISNVTARFKKQEEVSAPKEKECPFCKSTIAINATRCPHCTSELESKTI